MARIIFMDDFGRENHKAAAEITTGRKTEVWKDIFRSGYTVSDYPTGDPEELKYKGKYYSFTNRMAVETDVTQGERMKICYLYALSRYAEAAGLGTDDDIEVIMAETSPVEKVGRDSQIYPGYFENDADNMEMTVYKGTNRFFWTKKCVVLPEGAVIFAPYQEECKESDILVLDIGSRTMNVIVWHYDIHAHKWVMVMSFTEDVGSILMLNAIKSRLRLENVSISEDTIESCIYGREISTGSADLVRRITNEEVEKYISQKIIGTLNEHLVDITLPVYLGGGSGDMMFHSLDKKLYIKENIGVYANALGGLSTLKTVAKMLEKKGI